MTQRRYIICCCDTVYERITEALPTAAFGSFRCACGAVIGAWNGRIALRYEAVQQPDAAMLAHARSLPWNDRAA